jgi:diguanylate cyclase (GGDEF)-like protein
VRLHDAVAALRLEHRFAPSGRVSVSVGGAMLASAALETGDALVQRADAALYAAKRAGRDRVVVAF